MSKFFKVWAPVIALTLGMAISAQAQDTGDPSAIKSSKSPFQKELSDFSQL